jgi:hypothetical protein
MASFHMFFANNHQYASCSDLLSIINLQTVGQEGRSSQMLTRQSPPDSFVQPCLSDLDSHW